MKLYLTRKYKNDTYTISKLYKEDGEYLCDVIEDKDRGLDDSMSLEEIKRIKVPNQTAIPTGTYTVVTNIKSPHFSKKQYYKEYCDGYLPRLLNVKGFDGILIHRGIDQNSSSGCLIVGYNNEKGKVLNSKEAFEKVYQLLINANSPITITIN